MSELEDHVARFRTVLGERLGLAFEDERLGQLAEVLSARVAANGGDTNVYLERLEHPETVGDEVAIIARLVTIGETYFFRHSQQFDALRWLLDRWRGAAPPRLLSAGCASGEEAYSLAIMLRERWPDRDAPVLAIDVNPAVIERAREGKYAAWSLRETPPATLSRWFQPIGRDYQIDPVIRRSVRFVCGNLSSDDATLLPPGSFDVIFCRNMLMYFTPEKLRAAVERLSNALVPGGHLFLGSAETLRGVSHDYHLCHTHESFYYQRKSERELSSRPGPMPSALLEPRAAGAVTDGAAWVEEISRAAARIIALTDEPRAAPVRASTRAAPTTKPAKRARGLAPDAPALGAALDLLHKEQFSEALDRLRALPPDLAGDPEALLLEAVLLASSGDFAAAERACQRLLELDELNAGAHYVLALCSAAGGRRERAVHHDRVAMYLDPAFAMPRLHLGLLLRREGDRPAARIELRHARSLLEREDGARLLMFGGGFSRSALLALCSAELELTAGGG